MNILCICQYYYPEPFRISDICEEFVKIGHKVTVITGIPNYPMGKIYEDYRFSRKKTESINGVEVHRCFTVGRKRGWLWRILNYYSYLFSSKRFVSKLPGDYDVVFVNQLSPVMMAEAGIKYKNKYGKRLILYCLDLWPESLVAGRVRRNSFIYRYFHKVSGKIYSQSDKILITSKSFKTYFENEFNIRDDKINYLPQYAEELFSVESCKKQPNDTIDLMFAGNIGNAQSVQTIIKAADLTRDIKNLKWHIVGDGSELDNCKILAEKYNLKSVVFYGRKPVEQMPKYYAMADAMIITMQSDPVLSLTVPGKLQTYMLAGKPIIGAINGETYSIIKKADCGYAGEAEDQYALANNVRLFILNRDNTFGENSYNYYLKNFSKNTFCKTLLNEFKLCVI
ncbi:MAG: glycosyltransferase WbuB [Clostridiales bacterium]|nr:MAG: glycosyltransferase WbuB [Clostridiales bacterium]